MSEPITDQTTYDPVLEAKLEILHLCLTPHGFLKAEDMLKKLQLVEPNKNRFANGFRLFLTLRDSGINDPFDQRYIKLLSAFRDVLLEELEEYNFEQIAKELGVDQENLLIQEKNLIEELIFRISQNYDLLYRISPRDFERIIKEIFSAMGYEVELTKQTRDGGYDLVAIRKMDGFSLKFLVECKRTTRPVGVKIVREFLHVIGDQKANKGIIVATSFYTEGAIKQQSFQPYLLDLKDKDHVIRWIEEYTEKRRLTTKSTTLPHS